MELAKQIGKRLRKARLERRITQEEVGLALGIGRAGYANIETGRSLITVEHLVKIPAILGEPITYFLNLENSHVDAVSDSAKIDAIWKAIQQKETSELPPQKEYQDKPDKEILGEIWDNLDAVGRQAIFDYARWRYLEQYRRRNSSGKLHISEEKKAEWQKDMGLIDLRLWVESATMEERKELSDLLARLAGSSIGPV